MYAFDFRIAYSTDCNKTHHRVNLKSDPTCKNMVSVTDTMYGFPMLY